MIDVLDMQAKPLEKLNISSSKLAPEDDKSVIMSTETLMKELDDLHNRFDQATEPILVESIVYEMQAVQLRYVYYLSICKERGLSSERWGLVSERWEQD